MLSPDLGSRGPRTAIRLIWEKVQGTRGSEAGFQGHQSLAVGGGDVIRTSIEASRNGGLDALLATGDDPARRIPKLRWG